MQCNVEVYEMITRCKEWSPEIGDIEYIKSNGEVTRRVIADLGRPLAGKLPNQLAVGYAVLSEEVRSGDVENLSFYTLFYKNLVYLNDAQTILVI